MSVSWETKLWSGLSARQTPYVFPRSGVLMSFVWGAVTLLWVKLFVHTKGEGVPFAGLQNVNTLILDD